MSVDTGICTYGCCEEFDIDELVEVAPGEKLCEKCFADHCRETGTDPRDFLERGDAA